MTNISGTSLWFKDNKSRAWRALRLALVAFVILGLVGLYLRPAMMHVHSPLLLGVLIGSLMLSLIASAARRLRRARRP
ncbi:hypothetical protein ATE68_07040 [Sphingopyxis sp. H038]|jgi:cyanate permease|uniref:hypothetical protein n=1 Tax=unclassified Sphingopyxis TaxID=2614943 RepID=UPI000736DFC6|nr:MULTISPECIES: hypothetical protein [unclassified Sphingopyxis]KTE02564.1 hypothetical protein ATE78_09580 [Sphingopyxis sp. H012]KTE35613.1 hypothetical protein ATE68_07040 [Sphingopyxis sp. H038]